MFWNVENFFSYRNDSTSVADAEFSSFGERYWTKKRFNTKCNSIAKTILWAGSPDIVGFAEIENKFVVNSLIYNTLLWKQYYTGIHFDSFDHRGIDVAVIYRRDKLELIEAKPFHIYKNGEILHTRDILYTKFKDKTGRELIVLTNHLPSKYNSTSSENRELCVDRLVQLMDSLIVTGKNRIVIMGDFNEVADNQLFTKLKNFQNKGLNIKQGSLKYDGKWQLVDFFFILGQSSEMTVLEVPFLQTEDTKYGGMKPWRTYVGPKYVGGVSDHCPIIIEIY